ncbi:MAG: hypothetical protein QM731_07655 [Chitinophagaceae bacterium]
MKKTTATFLLAMCAVKLWAQDKPAARALTMAEYDKAKSFAVKDLDNDTYVKFDNAYILDRYESRKPYFITGDDGNKKRIDLYKLIAKEGMQELGIVVFYTNEKGTLYKACMPNFNADAKVWEKYFEDIHAIDKQEANFVLKLSYVLSKEFGFQLYKAANAGKDMSKESATYGNDICFPGTMEVAMANGSKKLLRDIHSGDQIITVDAATQKATTVTVQELTTHEAKNYAITNLLLVKATEMTTTEGVEVQLLQKELHATPNHPMHTAEGQKKIGEVATGDKVLCKNEVSGQYETFVVWNKTETAGGVQKVYNIVANGGNTFMMNDVMVLQK